LEYTERRKNWIPFPLFRGQKSERHEAAYKSGTVWKVQFVSKFSIKAGLRDQGPRVTSQSMKFISFPSVADCEIPLIRAKDTFIFTSVYLMVSLVGDLYRQSAAAQREISYIAFSRF
jgi:hypothetical protein